MLEEIGLNRAGSLRSRRALLELRIGANSPPSQVSIDRKCMLGLFQVNLTNRSCAHRNGPISARRPAHRHFPVCVSLVI